MADVRGRNRRLISGERTMKISGEKRQIRQRSPRFKDSPFHISRKSAGSTEISPNISRNVLLAAAFCLTLGDSADLFAGNGRGYSRTQNAPIVSADRFRVVMTCAL